MESLYVLDGPIINLAKRSPKFYTQPNQQNGCPLSACKVITELFSSLLSSPLYNNLYFRSLMQLQMSVPPILVRIMESALKTGQINITVSARVTSYLLTVQTVSIQYKPENVSPYMVFKTFFIFFFNGVSASL